MGPDPASFRALIERSPIVTYVADESGEINYVSAQITESTGCRRTSGRTIRRSGAR